MGTAAALREIQPRPNLRQCAKRCGDGLGCGDGVYGSVGVWQGVSSARTELWRGDFRPSWCATRGGDLLQGHDRLHRYR